MGIDRSRMDSVQHDGTRYLTSVGGLRWRRLEILVGLQTHEFRVRPIASRDVNRSLAGAFRHQSRLSQEFSEGFERKVIDRLRERKPRPRKNRGVFFAPCFRFAPNGNPRPGKMIYRGRSLPGKGFGSLGREVNSAYPLRDPIEIAIPPIEFF